MQLGLLSTVLRGPDFIPVCVRGMVPDCAGQEESCLVSYVSVPQPRYGILPVHLQGLMGEANMRCARGEYDDAIKMCMEIVRLRKYGQKCFFFFLTLFFWNKLGCLFICVVLKVL